MTRALILYSDGRQLEVKNLGDFHDYKAVVGGYVEILPTNEDGYFSPEKKQRRRLACYVNDSGLLIDGMRPNPYACVLALLGVVYSKLILGNIIVVNEGEDGDDYPVDPYIINLFERYDKCSLEKQEAFLQSLLLEQAL